MRAFRIWATVPIVWLACLTGGSNANTQGNSTLSAGELMTELPSCALTCIVSAVTQSDCGLTDLNCICNNQQITATGTPCIRSSCTVREALLTQRLQAESCGLPVRNRSGLLRRVQWTGFGLAIAAVLFRVIAKLPCFEGPDLWWDDYTAVADLLIYVGSNILLNRLIDNGLGQDIWMLQPEQITTVQKAYYYSGYTYIAGMHLIKISIVLLYIRIFPKASVPRWFTWLCYVLIVSLIASFLALCIANLCSCTPINYNWLGWDGEHKGTCINRQGIVFGSAGINIFFDLIVFLMPLPLVIPLQISKMRKAGALLVFMIGLFVTICSIIRLQYLVYWGKSENPTWDNTELAIWSSVEGNWALITACMPSMAAPIKKGWRKVRHAVGQYSTARGTTRINSLSGSGQRSGTNVFHEYKGFEEQRPYARPVESSEDMELDSRPATKKMSF